MAIPERVMSQVSELEKQRLLNLFLTQFCGNHRAGKKRDFLKAMYGNGVASDESYNNSHDRAFRLMVDALIEDGYPICSSSGDGYWYGTSITDGMASVKEGYSRANAIRERADKLEKNLLEKYGGQFGMGF